MLRHRRYLPPTSPVSARHPRPRLIEPLDCMCFKTALCVTCSYPCGGAAGVGNSVLPGEGQDCSNRIARRVVGALIGTGAWILGASALAITTEPIGSIPRPPGLTEARRAFQAGFISQAEQLLQYDAAVRGAIACFEATGSRLVMDGEQAKDSFVTYPIHGLSNIAPDGIAILFADGHIRRLPRLTAGPFGYQTMRYRIEPSWPSSWSVDQSRMPRRG